MAKTVSAGLLSHLGLESTTLATLWRIIRVDGQEFYFTDHDKDLPFDGNTYESAFGYNRTAVSNQVGLSVDNLDVSGFLDSSALTETELRAGLFDYAEVRVSVVNWANLSDGELKLRRGRFGEVIYSDSGVFKTELRGMTQQYSQNVVELFTPDCRADLGDSRCKIAILPDEVSRLTAYAVGDSVRASNSKFIALTVTNGDAESGTTGWTNETGTLATRGASPSPDPTNGGAAYFYGGTDALTVARQDITVPGAEEALIDAGERRIRVLWLQNTLDEATDDTAAMEIDFLDSLGGVISGVAASQTAPLVWTERFLAADVPANTRTIRLRMRMTRNTGVDNDGLIDFIRADLIDQTLFSADFDNRTYVCTVAGTTAAIQPTYDTTISNTTVDGTATFQATEAFTRSAVVATVTDNRNMSITVDESRAVDNWFKYGAVVWESGNNAGLAMEVKASEASAATGATQLNVTANDTFTRPSGSFLTDGFEVGMKIITTDFSNAANNGTFTVATVAASTLTIEEATLTNETGSGDETMTAPDGIELFLSMPFDIQVGDTLSIYAGCDKLVATCIAKFNNIVNFRGEPFVPGPDAFLSIKTRTGTVTSSGGKF